MTLSELQALSDDELIERLAVEVMGWKKGTWKTRDRWPDFIATDSKLKRHWNPLTDWNHTMEVRAKVGEMDVEFIFDGCRVWIWPEIHEVIKVFDESPQRAIVLASLLAIAK